MNIKKIEFSKIKRKISLNDVDLETIIEEINLKTKKYVFLLIQNYQP